MQYQISSAAGNLRRARPAASLVLAALAWLGLGSPALAGTLGGTVLDAATWKPLANVQVSGAGKSAVTDASGKYRLEVPAGVQTLTFAAPGRPPAVKFLVARPGTSALRLDALLPAAKPGLGRLVLDRGALLDASGKPLSGRPSSGATIARTDAFGNQDQFVDLGVRGFRAFSPIWNADGRAIFYGVEGTFHKQEDRQKLGVFRFEAGTGKSSPVMQGTGIIDLRLAPTGNVLAAAGLRELFVITKPDKPAPNSQLIMSISKGKGWVLGAAWGPELWLYVTVDDQVQIDARRSYTRSRIARIHATGRDLNPAWAADMAYSFRYACPSPDGKEMLYSRFRLDGKDPVILAKNLATGAVRTAAAQSMRPVRLEPRQGRLYYIFQNDLHLRDLKSGTDLVLVSSVENADFTENK
jgi:hypothetical protein